MEPARLNACLTGTAEEMYQLIYRLYPICRSITGNGVRKTLQIIQEHIPLTIQEVPTGSVVFDWTVPKEWNIRDAYIKTSQGQKIVDFHKCNLHVVSYSVPITRKISLDELKAHTFALPEHPDWIPYRTSYYKEDWGFCLTYNQLLQLDDDEYEVFIDASLENGHLTYGEYFLKGEREEEILISTHVCHPSLVNDNLSGIAVATFLAKALGTLPRRYSYRFLFTPGAIGSITWLSLNEDRVRRIKHGLVLTCVGDSGKVTYKKTRRGNSEIDRVVAQVLKDSGDPYDIVEFSPYGHAERQFCSPGFNLSVGCFMRTPDGKFPEYHTSADNLQLVKREALVDSFDKCLSIFHLLEHNQKYMNQNPKCEPQLGKRGLYSNVGGALGKGNELAMLWVLNLSDGNHSLLDIAERSRLEFVVVHNAAQTLLEHGLLREASETTPVTGDIGA